MKNVLELYPEGLLGALQHFDEAWCWALQYRFSSSFSYLNGISPPVIDSTLLADLYPDLGAFKEESRALLAAYLEHHTQDDQPTK